VCPDIKEVSEFSSTEKYISTKGYIVEVAETE